MARQPRSLDPDARSTLGDVLLPPEGYRLDHALGTAYSLDAETLVTIPLFASGLDASEIERPLGIARIYELGTRLTLLVQGDRIAISKRWADSRPLLGLLGDAVVPCSIKDGSFHPKLLVLEFVSLEVPGLRFHRVVVATRNLTTDNSWDSVVVLDETDDGVVVPGLVGAVRDLARFVNDRDHPAAEHCHRVARALSKVKFQPLRGLSELEVRLFHPDSRNAEDLRAKIQGDDLLVISPFVRQGFLDKVADQVGASREHRWLVTRPVQVPDSAFAHYQVFQITDGAVPMYERRDAGDAGPEEQDELDGDTRGRLVGLHAKIYIASSKTNGARIVITSANATPAGWKNNVEVAVTGTSHAKALQVPTIVAPRKDADHDRTFGDLLDELTPEAIEAEERDPEWILEARHVLAGASATGLVTIGPPRSLDMTITFPVDGRPWPADLQITAYPFGYSNHHGPLTSESGGLIGRLMIEPGIELTPFIVLVLTRDVEPPMEIVLAMRLEGDLDWGREDARKTLAQAAKPQLLQELLWHFGVRGRSSSSALGDINLPHLPKPESTSLLPILEKILQRVHGPNDSEEVETINSLLAGVENDPDYAELIATWHLVRGSLK